MEIADQEEEDEDHSELNWNLIVFRWIILILFGICLIFNIFDCVHHAAVITYYSACAECEFTYYEALVLAASLGMIGVLLLGIYLVLLQKTRALRVYNMIIFLTVWLQMLLILVLTQRYPIAHIVHYRWLSQKSLAYYEKKYSCCGVLGPDDYLLTSGELPRSCFASESQLTKDLYYSGCLNRDTIPTTLFRSELLTPLFQLLLVILVIVYYLHLKNTGAPVRSIRNLWQSCIIF
ncbi:protein late bloomer [Drosophila innubila]|uniref:protein late bloomer n=1 Tax=Drosophila innubila TaxID=198719 RepID=UPI00148CF47C|nr:protein late bloomer [Drosophila innubila]